MEAPKTDLNKTARRRLILNIARSCFTKCLGCYNYFGKAGQELVSAHVIYEFLKEVGTRISKVTVGGGDPLSRPDIFEILSGIKSLGYHINMDTVGTPILNDAKTIFYGKNEIFKIGIEKLASHVDVLGIPVDGSNNSIVSAFRSGRPMLFDEQMEILAAADSCEIKVNVCINTVVGKHNINDLTNILSAISEHPSVRKWQLFQFMPIGPLGSLNRDKYEINDADFHSAVNNAEEFRRRNHLNVKIEPKSAGTRKDLYLIIGADGTAWLPSKAEHRNKSGDFPRGRNRKIIGNIASPDDYKTILQHL